MLPSSRVAQVAGPNAGGWALYYKSRALKAQGVPIVDLTIGEHDVSTDPSILAAMDAAAQRGNTGYAPVPGMDPLREAVAARVEAQTGVPTGPENVLITPGGQAALFAAHYGACEVGDRALYLDPYYATYPDTLRAANTVPVRVETHAEDGFQPRAADIDTAVGDGAASLLINTPNNPTGAVYNRDTLAGIAEVCRQRGLWLISDEVYDGQVWNAAHLSARALPEMAAQTLIVGSMSKSFAMTGSRIGWLVGPEPTISALAELAVATTYGVPGYIQEAALFALRNAADLEPKIAAPFARRRMITMEVLGPSNRIHLHPCEGAMYAMVDVRSTGRSGEDFAEGLLERERIAVMPGESFGQASKGHIRIAMTVDDDAYRDALTRLVRFADVCAAEEPA